MRFSYLTTFKMQELWPVGCRVRLLGVGSSTLLTIAPHVETGKPYNMRYSTSLKSGPALNVRYPKSWTYRDGGWIFIASLRLVGKCVDGTCRHRAA